MRPPSGEEHWPSVLLLGETEIAVIEVSDLLFAMSALACVRAMLFSPRQNC